MTSYKPGDVVLVPFPFTDQTTSKKRPAVIVSSPLYQNNRPDLIVLAITSQVRSPTVWGDVFMNHWQEAGLLKPSVIKPVIATVEKGLVLRKLGSLHSEDFLVLQNMMKTSLAVGEPMD